MTTEDALRILQGVGMMIGGVLAVVSVWQPTLPGGLPTVGTGLGAFALGFLSAAGAEYAGGRTHRAGLSVLATLLFVLIAVGTEDVGLTAAVALLLVGGLLLTDSLDQKWIRDRLSRE